MHFASLNIRSLLSNFNHLVSIITNLTTNNVNLAVVALQETWSVPYPDLVQIPGFKLILKTRTNSRGGGIGFYIKESLDHKIINNLSPFFEKDFECLTIETSIQGRKTVLSNIYRSPSSPPDLFINRLDSHLHNLYQLNPDSLVFLDSNINLLKITNYQPAMEYLDTIHNNGFLQLISKATHIAGDSFSLIDHILCKNFTPTLLTSTLITDISDHFMNFLCTSLPSKPKRSVNNIKYSRCLSLHNMTNFRNALSNLNWHSAYSSNDVDISFQHFWDSFSTLYDLYFPLRKVSFNKNIHSINDFMTNGLLISRKHKLELHKLALINPSEHLKLYRQYRNIFNSLLRASKSSYYDAKFSQYAKNPKKTWDLLNELTSNSHNAKSLKIPSLITPTETISDPTAIAEEFNSFFSQAGKNISDSVPPTTVTPESYFPLSNIPSFELGNAGPIHISDLIKSFPNKTSVDIDGISLKLLKFIKIEISTPLAHIFYLSLTNVTFPSKLKLNRTVPIFKSSDAKKCDNYRPISLIPTL
jgi:hypothetical protein